MKLCDSWNGSISFTICYKPMLTSKDIQETVFNYVGTPTVNHQRKVVLLTNMVSANSATYICIFEPTLGAIFIVVRLFLPCEDSMGFSP
jgi:hypothetical protein